MTPKGRRTILLAVRSAVAVTALPIGPLDPHRPGNVGRPVGQRATVHPRVRVAVRGLVLAQLLLPWGHVRVPSLVLGEPRRGCGVRQRHGIGRDGVLVRVLRRPAPGRPPLADVDRCRRPRGGPVPAGWAGPPSRGDLRAAPIRSTDRPVTGPERRPLATGPHRDSEPPRSPTSSRTRARGVGAGRPLASRASIVSSSSRRWRSPSRARPVTEPFPTAVRTARARVRRSVPRRAGWISRPRYSIASRSTADGTVGGDGRGPTAAFAIADRSLRGQTRARLLKARVPGAAPPLRGRRVRDSAAGNGERGDGRSGGIPGRGRTPRTGDRAGTAATAEDADPDERVGGEPDPSRPRASR